MAQASDRAELNGVEMELAAAAVRDAGARARGESVVDLFVHTACAESQYACRATSTTESAFHTYRCCASLIPCGDCHQLRLREPRLSGPFADAVLVATEAHDRNAFSRRAEVAARCPPVTQPHSAAARALNTARALNRCLAAAEFAQGAGGRGRMRSGAG